jgi:putative secretion ATPase (PEP-CTERM system associated)
MYTSFYNLTARPFQLSPNHRFFFGSKGHRRAMAYLTYGLHEREGFIVVTGDVGTGKTTLVDYLAEQLSAGPFVSGRISVGQIEPANVLALIAKAFQLPPADLSQAELQQQLEDFLITRQKARQRPLLIVDEAQSWPLPALEELRVIANLQHGGKALLQTLLVGQPQFRDALAQSDFEQLRQRVVASHHLEPLDDMEVGAYIEHRLTQAGWQGDPNFAPEVYGAIFEHSRGVARKINLLCSRLLVLAALEKMHAIDLEMVRTALAELDRVGSRFEPVGPVKAKGVGGPVANGNGKHHQLDEVALNNWGDIEHWRQETVRLMSKLERAHDDLQEERRRADASRAEAEKLKERLHQLELEHARLSADISKPMPTIAARDEPVRSTIFRRFGSG